MCGIVGLFLKDPHLEPELGMLVASMLGTLCDRGPDSAGFAIYGNETPGTIKLTLRAPADFDFEHLTEQLENAAGASVPHVVRDTHMVVTVPLARETAIRAALTEAAREVSVVGARAPHGDLQGGRPTGSGCNPFRIAAHGRHPRHRSYAHGHGIRRDDGRRPSVLRPARTSAWSTMVLCRTTIRFAANWPSMRKSSSRLKTTPKSPQAI